eukprot:465332_1
MESTPKIPRRRRKRNSSSLSRRHKNKRNTIGNSWGQKSEASGDITREEHRQQTVKEKQKKQNELRKETRNENRIESKYKNQFDAWKAEYVEEQTNVLNDVLDANSKLNRSVNALSQKLHLKDNEIQYLKDNEIW